MEHGKGQDVPPYTPITPPSSEDSADAPELSFKQRMLQRIHSTFERAISALAELGEPPSRPDERLLSRFRLFQWLVKNPKATGLGGLGLSFGIFLWGIGTELDGGLKTAAAAFFFAWTVFVFAVYASSWWVKRRSLAATLILTLGIGLIGVWRAYLPAPPLAESADENHVEQQPAQQPTGAVTPTLTPAPPSERLTFRPAVEKFTINFGDRVFVTRPAELADKPFEPLILKGSIPFRGYVENGFLYVDAQIHTDSTAEPVIEIKRNQYKKVPPGWDVNSTPVALEIVNEKQEPIFHLIYKSPSEVMIEGVFPHPEGYYVIDRHGQRLNDKPDIIPIFKYPAWKYPGQYADESPTPAPSPSPSPSPSANPRSKRSKSSQRKATPCSWEDILLGKC